MHYLQKYKGKSTRHTCPLCETNQSFTLYLNGDTHEPIHRTVGICNRETKCGYHYTPKQYFMDNPDTQKCSQHFSNTTNVEIRSTPSPSGRAGVGSISFSYVQNSASYKSNFIRFLCEFLTVKQMKQA
ncbi:MAG: PG0870-related protein, partial [Bacteroidales bacterium]